MKTIKLLFIIALTLSTVNTSVSQTNKWSATNKFKNCMTAMKSTNNEKSRFNIAMNYFLTEHTTIIQLQDALHFLNSDSRKYQLGVVAYTNIIDKDHFFNVYDAFKKFSWAIKLYHNTQEKQKLSTLENNYQLKTEKDNNSIFKLLLEKGDLLLSENKFKEATLIYEQALEIRPKSEKVKEKIEEVSKLENELASIIEAENRLNTEFDTLIHDGDLLLSANKIEEAIIKYEKAMALKPGDETAYLRIKEANNWKTELNSITAEKNKQREQYDFLIQKGDILLSSGNFEQAISTFKQASTIFPNEEVAFLKIEEAKSIQQELIVTETVCSTTSSEFKNIMITIEDQTFTNDQLEMAKKHIQKNCLSLEQMKAVTKIFSMDDAKLKIIKFMYDYSNEVSRFYEFRELLTFNSTQRELDKFLVNKN